MPGPITLVTLGVGAAGAAAYVRRNSQPEDNTPFNVARRKSTVIQDHDWQDRKQPEYLWRRDNGINFSHNSNRKFPTSTDL